MRYCGKHITTSRHHIREVHYLFEDLVLGMSFMGSTRCGVSAKQIQRETGVTYKTAWRMFEQIRTLMADDIQLEGSSVEMDETYMGGKRKNGTGRPMAGDKVKTPVVGMVERRGRVVALVAPDVKSATLLDMVHERILPSSTIYTASCTDTMEFPT